MLFRSQAKKIGKTPEPPKRPKTPGNMADKLADFKASKKSGTATARGARRVPMKVEAGAKAIMDEVSTIGSQIDELTAHSEECLATRDSLRMSIPNILH